MCWGLSYGYKPNKKIEWNNKNTSTSLDKGTLLGHSVYEIGSKINYSYKTITSKSVTSVGLHKTYNWNTIMNSNDFKKSFGSESDIYKFASEYYDAENENFWIINYDDFYYSYESHSKTGLVSYSDIDNCYYGSNSFGSYLVNNGANIVALPGKQYSTSYYSFTEEYTFDISATSITYRDSKLVKRTLPVSVAPVMEKEGSAGGSDNPFCIPGIDCNKNCDLICMLKKALAIFGIILGVLFLIYVISSLIKLKNKRKINKFIKEYEKQ